MNRSQDNTARAFTLIEILCIVGIFLVMAAILLSGLAKQKARSSRISCNNNLHQIQKAFRMWSMDNRDKYPMQVSVTNGGTMELVKGGTVFVHFLVMSNELSTPKLLICPEEKDSGRKVATTFNQTVRDGSPFQVPFTNDQYVSYFIGVDADSAKPAMLLVGDGNLALDGLAATHGLHSVLARNRVTWKGPRHEKGGYVSVVDGGVQHVMNPDWPQLLLKTGQPSNRLALP